MATPKPCKWGDNCNRTDCYFSHPSGDNRVGLTGGRNRRRGSQNGRGQNGGRGIRNRSNSWSSGSRKSRFPSRNDDTGDQKDCDRKECECKYGDKCRRADCYYTHPSGNSRHGLTGNRQVSIRNGAPVHRPVNSSGKGKGKITITSEHRADDIEATRQFLRMADLDLNGVQGLITGDAKPKGGVVTSWFGRLTSWITGGGGSSSQGQVSVTGKNSVVQAKLKNRRGKDTTVKIQGFTKVRKVVRPIKIQICFLFDKSGSMSGSGQAYADAISDIQRFVGGHNGVSYACIMCASFSSQYNGIFVKSDLKKFDTKKFHRMNKKMDGGTALWDSIVASTEEMDWNGAKFQKMHLTFTDGGDNMSRRHSASDVKTYIRRKASQQKIQFSAVAAGSASRACLEQVYNANRIHTCNASTDEIRRAIVQTVTTVVERWVRIVATQSHGSNDIFEV